MVVCIQTGEHGFEIVTDKGGELTLEVRRQLIGCVQTGLQLRQVDLCLLHGETAVQQAMGHGGELLDG